MKHKVSIILRREMLALFVGFAICLPTVSGAAVHELCDPVTPSRSPFPNDRFTVTDLSQNTRLRVNLPKPDCATLRSDCEDLDVINTLDGFSLQPRLSIPFDGPIDARTVTSDTVYLVKRGNIRQSSRKVGINRVFWDPATSTLFAEPDELLEQHTRYVIVVTTGVRDLDGNAVSLASGCARAFTTRSVTAILEKIRGRIKSTVPNRADFLLGPGGARTVFPLDQVQSIAFSQQTRVSPPQFTAAPIPLQSFGLVPGVVGRIAFGKYVSPDFMAHPGEFIPPAGTSTGTPRVSRMNELYFNLYLPSGRQPIKGWPVAIFSHGANGTKDGGRNIAASLAAHGVAAIVINHVGHGGGPLSTLTVTTTGGASVTFSAGGRAVDQNGDGVIALREGDTAPPPRSLLGFSDGIRQTVVDQMQLVRVIQMGVDVDGDLKTDLDPTRIYHIGNSLGGAVSIIFMAVEPDVRAGVFVSPVGGPDPENARLSPVNRTPNLASVLASRVPSLINAPGIASVGGIPVAPPLFNENKPLRNQLAVINTVEGATAIQTVLDRMEWAREAGIINGYIRHLRKEPLEGVPIKSILFHFAKGDQQSVDLNNSAILLAGDLVNRTTYYRHDLAFTENQALPKNAHSFTFGFGGGNLDTPAPGLAAIALAAQEQVAIFLESHGTLINQPQPVRYFESPIRPPLPDSIFYIP